MQWRKRTRTAWKAWRTRRSERRLVSWHVRSGRADIDVIRDMLRRERRGRRVRVGRKRVKGERRRYLMS